MTDLGDQSSKQALDQLLALLHEEELIRLRVRAVKRGLDNLAVTLSVELNTRDPEHHKKRAK
jgi:hypothetical protein